MGKILLFINLLIVLVFAFKLPYLPPQIPLFYSKPWGEDQLVDSWLIIILPILMNGFYFLNLWLYKKFFFDNLFIKKIVDYFNLFLLVIITLIFLRIVFLIT